jgi:capsular exopolysaccharide synthesis family protein
MPRLDKRLVSLTAPRSMEAEQYQALRLKLERLQRERNIRAIGITSPGAQDGKTVTAINLAGALAQGSDARVLLIEADLRRPAVSKYLGLGESDRPGLADLVMDPKQTLDDTVQRYEHPRFDVISAGTSDVPVHELFRLPRLNTLLKDMREQYDYVIVDTPPVGPVSDSALLARWLDGLVLVVAAHKTPRKQLEKALNMLDGASVLGIIFNRDEGARLGYRGDYRRYFSRTQRRPPQSASIFTAHQ